MTHEHLQELLTQVDNHIAERRFAEALDIAHSVRQSALAGDLYLILGIACNRLGNIYQLQRDYHSAMEFYDVAHLNFERVDSKIDIAKNIANMGVIHIRQSDYQRAAECLLQALSMNEALGYKEGIASNHGNLGSVYSDLADYPKALESYLKAVSIFEELGMRVNVVRNLNNVGIVYSDISDYPRALYFHHKAMAINEELGLEEGIATNLGNIGIVYKQLTDYPRALECQLKALAIHTKLGIREKIAINLCNIGIVYSLDGKYDTAIDHFQQALSIFRELGNRFGIANNLGNIGNVYQEQSKFQEALQNYEGALKIFEELDIKGGIAITYQSIGALYADTNYQDYDYSKAEYHLNHALELARTIGDRKNECDIYKLFSKLYKQQGRWKESQENFEKFYELEHEIQSAETKKQAEHLAYERQSSEREKSIAVERARAQATDAILANILPGTITERLIKGEKKIADLHENVCVLFADIVGFTYLSSTLPPGELIDLLDSVFTRFDSICKKHGLEKIKTIGDAYMAVCGMPLACDDSAERTARAAMEMMEEFILDREFSVPIRLKFRIGLHTGNVVAGIIGENKYAYDLWGDAVNTASRMESHGEPGKIHVSEEFLKKLLMVKNEWIMVNGKWLMEEADNFSSLTINNSPLTINNSPLTINHLPLTIIPRAEMDIKGKGIMRTYFLESKKP